MVKLLIGMLPVIAGLSYEVIRYAAKKPGGLFTLMTMPGLWLQRITTKEPSQEQMEVAIVALESAVGITDSKLSVKKTCL